MDRIVKQPAPDGQLDDKQTPVDATESAKAGQILQHSHDADEAMKAMAELHGVSLDIDAATNKRLLRRIDWNLMPILCVVYGLNYLDKTSISYASVMGIKNDIGLVGDQYQWLGSIFYFGYLAWEFPTNRLLQRLPLGKYSSLNIILWGITLASFAAVTSFSGAVAVRFFLGVFEAAVTPGFALFTSQWYTKDEQAFRTGIWFSFNGWAQVLGSLVAYGIARAVRMHGAAIASWRVLFLAFGLLTTVVGVIFWFTVPDSQLNARFLTKADRVLAVERIRKNNQGVGNCHWKYYQFREALMDPFTWMIVLYALLADIPNGGITTFFSQLIVAFGYTPEESLLLSTPQGAVEVVTLIGWGWISYYWGNRIIWSSFSLVICLLGMILIVALPLENSRGRLAGYCLTGASATPFVALLSLISSNVAGYTKKTTVAALYLIAYCVGNIIGPQTFRPKDAPRYVPGEVVIIVCWGLCLVILAVIYCWFRMQNAKKRRMRAEPGYTKLANQEFLDLTDMENPEFEYAL